MTATSRLLALLLVVALAGTGVLTPLAAVAQSQTQRALPDLYEEEVKASQPGLAIGGAYTVGALVATPFVFGGRAVLCGVGSVLTVGVLLITLGSGYGAAKSVFEEGCFGKWVVTPGDLQAANTQKGIGPDRYLESR